MDYKRSVDHFSTLGLQTLSLHGWRQRFSCGGSWKGEGGSVGEGEGDGGGVREGGMGREMESGSRKGKMERV